MPTLVLTTFQYGSGNGSTRCANITLIDEKSYEGDKIFTVAWVAEDSSVRFGTLVTSITILENEG